MKTNLMVLLVCGLCFKAVAGSNGWLSVLDNPLAKSRIENKLILVNFSESDGCAGCTRFEKEILAAPEFQSYAQKNLELVKIDSSTNQPQTEALKFANTAWIQHYAVSTLPTLILIDSNGRALGRQTGYIAGGAPMFIKELDGWTANYDSLFQDPDAGKWITDVPSAMAKARASNKLVLMDFTGSDWCIWCKRLDDDTLSKPDFIDYAKKNLVLVQLDYPERTPQPAALKNANAALAAKYKISGYPTVIVMRPDGTVIWRIDGYLEGGPKAMIAEIENAEQK